jgi:hypothetical protein
MILDGRKTQTFRATKRCDVGDEMHLFVGLRTKNCEIIKKVRCISVEMGLIDVGRVVIVNDRENNQRLDEFAQSDGFIDHNQMLQFFAGQGRKFPFHGWLHRWA